MSALSRRRLVIEAAVSAVALGIVGGAGWAWVAPEILGEVTAGGVAVRGAEARAQFGVLGWFVVVTAIAGVLQGVVTSLRGRSRPVASLFSVVVGGAAGAVIAWRVGIFVGPDPVPAGLDPGTAVVMPLELTWPGALLVWPIAGVIGAAVVAAVRDDRGAWYGSDVSPNGRSEPSSPR